MKAVEAAGGGARATGFTCPWGGHLVRCSADASIGRYGGTSTIGIAAALLPRVYGGSKLLRSGGAGSGDRCFGERFAGRNHVRDEENVSPSATAPTAAGRARSHGSGPRGCMGTARLWTEGPCSYGGGRAWGEKRGTRDAIKRYAGGRWSRGCLVRKFFLIP